jgi:transposase
MAQSPLRLRPHLTYRQLTARYKTAATNRQQRYWQLIRAMAHPTKPLLVMAAAQAAGFSQRWARQLVHRYNQAGPAGFYDKRRDNAGQDARLTPVQKKKLKRAIMQGFAPDGGLWSGQKVTAWIAKETGQPPPGETTGLNYLRHLGFTLQVPRPRHIQAADAAAQAAFKKSSTVEWPHSNVVFQTEW